MGEEWYKSWFDSPYYSMLYRHRDVREARQFMDQLMQHLRLPQGSSIIDLACGNGRHAIYLNQLGYDVTGVDLSKTKITAARRLANNTLHFVQGDIRDLEFPQTFDLALNLFTSIGYFADFAENEQVLASVHKILHPGSLLVIDFMNASKVERELVPQERFDIDSVQFEVRRSIKKGQVEKLIRVTDGDKIISYREAVQLLHLRDFDKMFKREGFVLREVWGSYTGAPFSEEGSDRLVLFAERQ